MGPVTVYWPETGQIVTGSWQGSQSALLSAYTDQGMAWVQVPSDKNSHYMPGGVKTDRPKLAPDTVAAPYSLDLTSVEGATHITDELEISFEAPGGEECELPAGVYDIVPPFPWRAQTIVVE